MTTPHAFDGAMQKAKAGDVITNAVEHAVVHALLQEFMGGGKVAFELEKLIDDQLLTPQLNDSLNVCKAIESVSNDPAASQDFLEATVGKSKIPQDFSTYDQKQRADCMIALLEANNTNLDSQEMSSLVDATSNGGAPKIQQICNDMKKNHPIA
ncbi:MAG: hypothetical protein K2Y22_05700 [Candidatus Obscuribacterales bacterium]|nr:hypothetical protein [Candidatus Obscuribacterales bacterium]